MAEEYVHEDITVKMSVIQKLPDKPLSVVWTQNMEGKRVMAFLILWTERHSNGMSELRKAYFSVETGEYISEGFLSEVNDTSPAT